MGVVAVQHAERHAERAGYLAGNYGGVQGLSLLPLGVWFLLVALGESGFDATEYMPEGAVALLVFSVYFVGFFVALALWFVAGIFYERSFGRVLPTEGEAGAPRRPFPERAARVVFVVLAVLAVLFSPPVALFGPALAWALFVFWCSQRRFGYHHYAALSALVVAASLLSVLGVLPAEEVRKAIDLAMVGVVLTVGGVFDHLLLARTMRPIPEEDREPAV